MIALTSVPAGDDFERQLAAADPDMLRLMVKSFAEALMSAEAEADAACGAEYGQVSLERTNSRNRTRGWNTRVGSIELAIPKLRSGSYFPDWLLERRRRADGVGVLSRPLVKPRSATDVGLAHRLARRQRSGSAEPQPVLSEQLSECRRPAWIANSIRDPGGWHVRHEHLHPDTVRPAPELRLGPPGAPPGDGVPAQVAGRA